MWSKRRDLPAKICNLQIAPQNRCPPCTSNFCVQPGPGTLSKAHLGCCSASCGLRRNSIESEKEGAARPRKDHCTLPVCCHGIYEPMQGLSMPKPKLLYVDLAWCPEGQSFEIQQSDRNRLVHLCALLSVPAGTTNSAPLSSPRYQQQSHLRHPLLHRLQRQPETQRQS